MKKIIPILLMICAFTVASAGKITYQFVGFDHKKDVFSFKLRVTEDAYPGGASTFLGEDISLASMKGKFAGYSVMFQSEVITQLNIKINEVPFHSCQKLHEQFPNGNAVVIVEQYGCRVIG